MGTVKTHLSAREIARSRGLLLPAHINYPAFSEREKMLNMFWTWKGSG
jgi:hypothetical protein